MGREARKGVWLNNMTPCNHKNKKCIDSRKVKYGRRRRYFCFDCKVKYTTLEIELQDTRRGIDAIRALRKQLTDESFCYMI